MLLRQRGLGNSATQLKKNKLCEQHGEAWLNKTVHYLTDCDGFIRAMKSGLVSRPSFDEPPAATPVPKYKWLLTVFCNDVVRRIDEDKAAI